MWLPKQPNVPYGLKDLVENFLPSEEVLPFAKWAFGEDFLHLGEIINGSHRALYENYVRIMERAWKKTCLISKR